MGRVAIVTGASAGIGAATSRLLYELGFHVYAVARRMDRMAPLAALGIHTVRADVTDEADLVALVDRVVAESGRIDVYRDGTLLATTKRTTWIDTTAGQARSHTYTVRAVDPGGRSI